MPCLYRCDKLPKNPPYEFSQPPFRQKYFFLSLALSMSRSTHRKSRCTQEEAVQLRGIENRLKTNFQKVLSQTYRRLHFGEIICKTLLDKLTKNYLQSIKRTVLKNNKEMETVVPQRPPIGINFEDNFILNRLKMTLPNIVSDHERYWNEQILRKKAKQFN